MPYRQSLMRIVNGAVVPFCLIALASVGVPTATSADRSHVIASSEDAIAAAGEELLSPEPFTFSDEGVVQLPEGFFPGSPKYLDYHLAQYGLSRLQGDLELRFLWLRSFHSAIVFEVRPDGDEYAVFTARVWVVGNDGVESHWRTFSSRRLPMKLHLEYFETLKKRWEFFDLPSFDSRQGLDGSDWIIEARVGETHHWVRRWSPEEDSPIRQVGMDLIELSIESPVIPIY